VRKQKRRVFNVARVSVGQLAARPERHLHDPAAHLQPPPL